MALSKEIPTFAKTTEYLKKISAWFEKQGFRVILRLGHNPDDDMVFMSGGPFILNPGTSLYSRIVEHVAQKRGCTIIRPLTEDKGRKYESNAPADDIHQSSETMAKLAGKDTPSETVESKLAGSKDDMPWITMQTNRELRRKDRSVDRSLFFRPQPSASN
jgi:hypothetical protein